MTDLEEIFVTEHGVVSQCNKTRRFILEFRGYQYAFKVMKFFELKNTIDNVDIDKKLLSTEIFDDLEIIMTPENNEIIVLSLCEIIHLKELLEGAKVMLDLNTLLGEMLNISILKHPE